MVTSGSMACFAGHLDFQLHIIGSLSLRYSASGIGAKEPRNRTQRKRRPRLPTPLHLRLRNEDPDNILSPLARMVHDQCERRNLDIRRRRQYTAVVLHFGYWLVDRGLAVDFTTDTSKASWGITNVAPAPAFGRCARRWRPCVALEPRRQNEGAALIPLMKLSAIDREVLEFDKMLERYGACPLVLAANIAMSFGDFLSAV